MNTVNEIHESIQAIAPLLALGAAAAASAASKGISKMMDGNQDEKQLKQAGKLQDLQLEGARKMADYNQEKAMAMWHETNYGAQRKEMEAAGLSPGLMYGLGGGGGATTQGAQASMPQGQSSADAASRQNSDTGMSLNMIQAANIMANTEKTKAETAKIAGADTDNTIANTALQKANEITSKATAALTNIQTELAGKSIDWQLDIIAQKANIATAEAESAMVQANIDQNTKFAKMDEIRANATNAALQALATKSGVELNKTKIEEISNSIQQKWRELEQTGNKNNMEHADRVKAIEEYTANALKVAGIQAASNLIGDAVKVYTKSPQLKGQSTVRTTNGNQTSTNTINHY